MEPQDVHLDTICCVLTPRGEGGLSVMHLRGPNAFEVIEQLFKGPGDYTCTISKACKLSLGSLVDGVDTLDEVMVARVPAPEPVIVNQCHAGLESVRRIAECLGRLGVREVLEPDYLARQGAVGELDAIQREAAAAIPTARSPLALTLLLSQYQGALSRFVHQLREGKAGARDAEDLWGARRLGEALTVPARVAIVGPPNVGKSSLFNALLKQDRVITTEVPGTTRDAIEEELVFDGIPFVLVDTAGLRETDHPIETMAINVSEEQVRRADVVLFLLDGSEKPTPAAVSDYARIACRCPRTVPAVNKIDLEASLPADVFEAQIGKTASMVSALEGTGLDELCLRLVGEMAPARDYAPGGPALFTARQVALFEELLMRQKKSTEPDEGSVQRICDELLRG